jgi:MFS family permease
VTPDDPNPLSLSQILIRMNVAAGFAAVFGVITATALARYGQTLGLSPFGFGVLAALPYVTALAQIPASFAVERFGGRKSVAIAGILTHRALWLAVAAVPWLVPRAWWWFGLLVCVGLSYTSAHIGAPATTSWAADLVPSRLRGRYYALRGQLVRIINVPLGLLLGWAMDRAQAAGFHTLLLVLSAMLAVAALSGMVDSLLCLKLPDRWHQPRAEGLRFRDILLGPLRNRNFLCFLGYTAFITLATGYIGPFVWLYLVDVVKTTNLEATFMTMVGTAVISLLGMRFWGRKVDDWGIRRVMLIAGVLIINGATTWALITPATKWTGYIAVLLSAFAWPAMELAAGNLLYSLSESRRDGANPGSAYVAITSAVVAIFGTLSGLFGGWVAELLQHWHTTVGGWPVTFHVVLFFISAGLRIVALLFIWAMRDERPYRSKRTSAQSIERIAG